MCIHYMHTWCKRCIQNRFLHLYAICAVYVQYMCVRRVCVFVYIHAHILFTMRMYAYNVCVGVQYSHRLKTKWLPCLLSYKPFIF